MHVFILSLIGQTIFNTLLLLLIRKASLPQSLLRRVGTCFVLIVYLVFVLIFAFRSDISEGFIGYVIRGFNSYYVALIIYVCATALVFGLLSLYGRLSIKCKDLRRATLRQWHKIALLSMIPITGGLCLWGHFNTVCPRVVRHEIHLPKTPNTPDQLKILFVSDIHIGEIIALEDIQRLQRMVRQESPDYVLVGGDILDYYTSPIRDKDLSEAMRGLLPDHKKVYYINGNHEYYYGLEEKEDWYRSIGTFLKDSVAILAPDVYLIGRDDYTNKSRLSLRKLYEPIPPGAVTIVLDHQPKTVAETREMGAHLALHGHTHDGQFVPFKWAVAAAFERSYGLYQKGRTTYCVSSGYGVAASTFRVGTRSEIVLLTIKFDQE